MVSAAAGESRPATLIVLNSCLSLISILGRMEDTGKVGSFLSRVGQSMVEAYQRVARAKRKMKSLKPVRAYW